MKARAEPSPYEVGRQHARLFLGFACFLRAQAIELELERLCFCTREGVFFKRVFDGLFDREHDSRPVPECVLIEASRLSTFAPSLLEPGGIDFGRLFRLYRKQSAASLLASLGMQPGSCDDILLKHALPGTEVVDGPGTNPRFRRFLQDTDFLARVQSSLLEQRGAAIGYLEPRVSGAQRIGIVDIGWQGTIQESIARLFPDRQFFGLYMGLALQRNATSETGRKIAFGPDRNVSATDKDLLDAVNVLEFTCLSNSGSAVRYAQAPDRSYIAHMQVHAEETRWIEAFSLPFQQGVLSVVEETLPGQLTAEYQSGTLRAQALEQWRRLLAVPPEALVRAYFSMKSNEEFGLGTVDDRSAVPSLWTVLLSPFVPARRRQLVRFLTYTQWAVGTLARKDLPLLTRVLLYGLTRFALAYKAGLQRVRLARLGPSLK